MDAKKIFNSLDQIKLSIDQHKDEIEKLAKSLESSLSKMKSGVLKAVQDKLLTVIENLNAAVENGIRISAYRAARMNGVSIDKSISLAKNLTVNFNRKGEWGSAINAFYIFYNASIQGSVRIAQAAYRSPKVRKMLYGIVGFGFFQDILNRAWAGEDEDGRNRYDKINSYTRGHSMIMWIPGTEKFISISIPYG